MEGRDLQDTATSLVRQVDAPVGEVYGCFRNVLAFLLTSLVQEKPDPCPSRNHVPLPGLCAREVIEEVASPL